MLKGLTLKATAFVVLILFILPMVSLFVPQIGMVDTAKAATALVNKASSATYRSSSGSFSGSGYFATAFPADSSATRPQDAFDDDSASRFYNGVANTVGPYGVMFAFNDTCDKKVNKIYLDIGNSASASQCPGKFTLIATNSISSFTRTSFSGTTIPGHLYKASTNVEMDDNTTDKGITTATPVSNSVPTTYPASINLSSVSVRSQYYFVPDAPINSKYIALVEYQNAGGQTQAGRISLYEMKLYDVRGDNLDLTVAALPTSQVILNPSGGTQNVNLPLATVADAAGNKVHSTMSSAVTITATSTDDGALPYGVSVDTTTPASPKLSVTADASPGAVRISWGYTDTGYTPNTSAVSVTKDITIESNPDLLDVTNDVAAVTTEEILGETGNTATFLATNLPALPTTGVTGSTFAWSSNSAAAVVEADNTVTVTRQSAITPIILTLTGTKGEATATKTFNFSVPGTLPNNNSTTNLISYLQTAAPSGFLPSAVASSDDGTNIASKALDEVTTDYWQESVKSSYDPQIAGSETYTIDLKIPYLVNSIGFDYVASTLMRYKIFGSNNNSTWTEVLDLSKTNVTSGTSGGLIYANFRGTAADNSYRYVKMEFISAQANASNYNIVAGYKQRAIKSIRLYGAKSALEASTTYTTSTYSTKIFSAYDRPLGDSTSNPTALSPFANVTGSDGATLFSTSSAVTAKSAVTNETITGGLLRTILYVHVLFQDQEQKLTI